MVSFTWPDSKNRIKNKKTRGGREDSDALHELAEAATSLYPSYTPILHMPSTGQLRTSVVPLATCGSRHTSDLGLSSHRFLNTCSANPKQSEKFRFQHL